ncbi:MAG: DUF998 domain-containing protein [Bacteroidales bacterium]
MKKHWCLYLGFLTPTVFWLCIIICGLIMGNYNHTTRLVCELGSIGTKTQYFFTLSLVLCAVLSVLFIIGLYKTAKLNGLNTIPILLILSFPFSICGAALFPLPMKLHGILGLPSLLLLLSPIAALLLWKTEKISSINYFSLLTLSVMLLGFSVYKPNFLSEYDGLKQRFFHIGWTIWFIYLSIVFMQFKKKLKKE